MTCSLSSQTPDISHRSLSSSGQPVVFLRMMESPGNYLVVMRRWKETLVLPCSYTGRLVSASGTYRHAVISWEAEAGDSSSGGDRDSTRGGGRDSTSSADVTFRDTNSDPTGETEQYWAGVASDMLEVELKPLPFS